MQRVLISGGTRGIGRGLADGFLQAGWDVVAAGLDAEQCHSDQERLVFRELDVTQPDSVAAVVEKCGDLDALVNAAGIIARDEEFAMDTFQRVVDVNLLGMMRVSTAAKAPLQSRQGAILNIASMLSFFGGGNVPAYASSKGGVAQLTKSLAIAWAAEGIRVNALAPGWIETEMTAPLRADPQRRESILGRTPMGRWGRVEDLVGPALFLCSPAAAFVTGAVLNVDGGYACV